ncbi:DUF2244 domain-containing protein [Paracoccus aerius]|uniref:DUF2244 domain-containing protein n=1 Tax=Paracoccus aerius TaxID=1915382 RepID=A0ABS1S967_9RHOB|nr:DUF2244 domain-containing protein [Paracoccus aerius]MBL3674634.1 DUF2244 domain-containing protein [Paracoccus aerius]GHG26787.1 hypothetical protein GCM10017322_26420 [Paracoccus aerius]
MPYEWKDTAPDDTGAVSYQLRLWPYQSLPPKGFVWFIGLTAGFMALPVVATLGTAVLWGLLPFVLLVIGGVWYAIQHSFRRGQTAEELLLNRRTAQVIRRDPGGGLREWTTNSYWLRPILRRGPVESYLTLTDGKREIELGAFLTPQERRHLHDDLLRRLANLR